MFYFVSLTSAFLYIAFIFPLSLSMTFNDQLIINYLTITPFTISSTLSLLSPLLLLKLTFTTTFILLMPVFPDCYFI